MGVSCFGDAFAQTPPVAAEPPEWTTPITPFHIAGNLYYVGSQDLASYLIVTPKGNFLINSSFERSVPLIKSAIEQLGFKYSDTKVLLISHAHADHDAGSAQIIKDTGARYMVMDGDVPVVESGGKTDFNYSKMTYPAAKVDRVLHDGDIVRLAGTVLVALPSGGTSYFYNFSPRAVVDYRFTDKIFGYASVSRGYKSGGYNAFDTGPTPPFAPEKNTAYEIGVKSDFLGGRARLNLSAFDYEYSNLQIRQGVPSGGVSIANVDSARSRGGEIEGQVIPLPGLTLTGNIAYDDATILKGVLGQVNGPSFVFGTAATSVVSVAANQLSRAPHWQTYLAADYKWGVSDLGTADVLFDFRSQSSEYFLETEQQAGNTFYGNGWSQVDLHVSFVPLHTRWTIAGFIENLNNERHVTQVAAAFALPLASVNAPRQFGLQLGYRF